MILNNSILFNSLIAFVLSINIISSQRTITPNASISIADELYQEALKHRRVNNDSLILKSNLALTAYRKVKPGAANIARLFGIMIEAAIDDQKSEDATNFYNHAVNEVHENSEDHCSALTYLNYTYNKLLINLRDYTPAVNLMQNYWVSDAFKCSDDRQKVYFLQEYSRTLAEADVLDKASYVLSVADSINTSRRIVNQDSYSTSDYLKGYIALRNKNDENAIKYFLDYLRHSNKDPTIVNNVHSILAYIYSQTNRCTEARFHINELSTILKEENDLEVLLKYHYKGLISICEHDYYGAIKYFNVALDSVPSRNESTETIRTDLFDIHYQLAKTYFKLYDNSTSKKYLDTAFFHTNSADSLAIIILNDQISIRSNLDWKAAAIELYDSAIIYAASSGRLNELWLQIENNKNYILAKNINIQKEKNTDKTQKKLLDSLEGILLELKQDVNRNNHEIQNIQVQFDKILMSEKINNPVQVNVNKSLDTKIFKDQYVVNYSISDSLTVALIIHNDNLKLSILEHTDSIRYYITAYHNVMNSPATNRYDPSLFRLRELLFDPIRSTGIEDFTIIADDELFFINFEALLESDSSSLINEYSFNYQLSTSIYAHQKTKPTKNTQHIIVNPDYGNSTYDPLPFSKEEANNISETLGNSILVNNKANFLNNVVHSSILHFSGHAIINLDNKVPSFLVFEDSKLLDEEIENLQLQSPLVFLSGCETAKGDLAKGEGVMSLTRSFTLAGARSIISSLWNADDFSTKEISIGFYNYLTNGMPKHRALRQAKLDYVSNSSIKMRHPYYWAGLIAYGDMQAMYNPTPIRLIAIVLCICLLGLLLLRIK